MRSEYCASSAPAGEAYLGGDIYFGPLFADIGSGDVCAPHGYIGSVGNNKVYIAVLPRSGIPARRFGQVLQPYGDIVFLAGLYKAGYVEIERIVSVGPVAGFLAVDIHSRTCDMAPSNFSVTRSPGARAGYQYRCDTIRCLQREASGASGMLHGFF